jgi:hypothetical protein
MLQTDRERHIQLILVTWLIPTAGIFNISSEESSPKVNMSDFTPADEASYCLALTEVSCRQTILQVQSIEVNLAMDVGD